jgi:hypothetical protein
MTDSEGKRESSVFSGAAAACKICRSAAGLRPAAGGHGTGKSVEAQPEHCRGQQSDASASITVTLSKRWDRSQRTCVLSSGLRLPAANMP